MGRRTRDLVRARLTGTLNAVVSTACRISQIRLINKAWINRTWINRAWINKGWINRAWINKALMNTS